MTPPKKTPAKRKSRAKPKPSPVVAVAKTAKTPDRQIPWGSVLRTGATAVLMLGLGAVGGWWASGGIEITPQPDDVLQQSYNRDRVTQIAVLRELAEQPFDGATDDGRRQAGEWYNANRFKNRAADFEVFTDRVAVSISENAEAELAADLEAELAAEQEVK